ncbi:MAG: 2,3-bisphosphoglycerate-independent phosphoglycerate mutase [Planctomycetes bacterium]|nr:2,3-bisphosphoglycerate-independent phosphoglycerate mutase [Planctomycetota bacterium]NUQ34034.1 2,3-bisphosphoglycerate-independent phosphoglycerate mutase [Planctomycetaceae bacterium]
MGNTPKAKVLLVILDGWGVNPRRDYNAIELANTTYWHHLLATYPNTTLLCGGRAVGLPDDQFGNSEVGHLNLGAGRVVYQDITRIDADIESGGFFKNAALLNAIEAAGSRGKLHLMGLVSGGGVHSIDRHYFALLELLKRKNFPSDRVCFHVITDGRDTAPKGGLEYVRALKDHMDKLEMGRIVSLSGRYHAMDRDKNWERTKRYWDCVTLGRGDVQPDIIAAIESSYAVGKTDEFIEPVSIVEHGRGLGRIESGDSVLWFNFRADRARQMTRALTEGEDFDAKCFKRGFMPKVSLTTMTHYLDGLNAREAYPPQDLSNTLGDYLSAQGLTQFRCAETEKYAHVTYFFNGGREQPPAGEERTLVPSPKVATYDLKPEMSLPEVAKNVAEAVKSGKYAFVLTNFANGDMVGHTGILKAAIEAANAVDKHLKEVVTAAHDKGYEVLVTADHGNCEEMMSESGEALTNHSYNPVPLIYVAAGDGKGVKLRDGGALYDVAPTILALMNLAQPREMTGKSLLISGGAR